MENRLKNLLYKVVSQNQGEFIKGQHILDNVILVQETIHSGQTLKEKGTIVKLDMSNTFDRVKHSFLFKVLEKFGFDTQFIKQIKACIGGPWITPLINGRPGRFFQAT